MHSSQYRRDKGGDGGGQIEDADGQRAHDAECEQHGERYSAEGEHEAGFCRIGERGNDGYGGEGDGDDDKQVGVDPTVRTTKEPS